MELDWKLIIALSALGISIYNLLDNRHMHKIEKRTIFLNELMETKLLLTEVSDILSDIDDIKSLKDVDYNQTILQLKNKNKSSAEELDELFEKIINNDKYDKYIFETSRPLLRKVHVHAKNSYRYASEYKKELTKNTSIK